MKVEQIYTGCLAQGAYYIESNGEAAIVDPLREVEPYIKKAASDGARIKYVLETHFHADFVSGHLDLSKQSGGTIIYGPTAKPAFPAHVASDGEVFQLGNITLTVLHTPGHTQGSTSIWIPSENKLIAGDTLFRDSIGRTDLPGGNSRQILRSIEDKLLPLPEETIVIAGHGPNTSIGREKERNPFLQGL